MDAWVETAAAEIARHAERELEALVGVSSPSGDVHGAEEAVALCVAFAPAEAELERIPCSTAGHADDLVLRSPAPARGGCCCSATSTRWSRTSRTGRSSAPATA